jgi:CheY-like chemotaxis protein
MPKNNILLVDDNPGITALMLKSRGYSVSIASDGLEGIEKAKSEHPDLILLDIMMPGIDGYEVCTKLKIDADTKHIPVIMLTAKEDPEAISKSHARGADGYIVKPFSLPVVLNKLKDFLP